MHERSFPFLIVVMAMLLFAAPAAALTLKIATIVPNGSAWMQEMRRVGKGANGKAKRGERSFADYLLFYKNIPLAVVEAKDNKHDMGSGMQQALALRRGAGRSLCLQFQWGWFSGA